MTNPKGNSGKGVRSNTRSTPQNSANVKSKRSPAKTTSVQSPATKEEDNQVVAPNPKTYTEHPPNQRRNFVVWITVMGAVLGYGMYQHDDYMLVAVMILVTAGCGFGNAAEVLIKFLDTCKLKLINPPKTE